MNISWMFWFQRGSFFKPRKKHPVSGTHGNKSWSDTHNVKTGKSEYKKQDNIWDDDGEFND